MTHLQAPRYRPLKTPRALTLIELMVTLVLSLLLLAMVLPLLHQLLAPTASPLSALAQANSRRPWERALQADLRELVSPSKCGIPVFELLPASETHSYPELVVQTFCRPSGTDLNTASRGPSDVRYCVETDSVAGPLVLVRYAKGWHDPAATRYVLAQHVTGWRLAFDGVAPALQAAAAPSSSPASSSGTDDAPPVPDPRPGRLVVQLSSTTGPMTASFWVPLLLLPASGSDAGTDPATGANGPRPTGPDVETPP